MTLKLLMRSMGCSWEDGVNRVKLVGMGSIVTKMLKTNFY
jgi:hypothetical protein